MGEMPVDANAKRIKLSRHFERNVKLITGICRKCQWKNSTTTEASLFFSKRSSHHCCDCFMSSKSSHDKNYAICVDDNKMVENSKNVGLDLKEKLEWTAPRSPHNLIEEDFSGDPWALLVATIFLNRTSCASARWAIKKFLRDYPTPQSVINAKPEDLVAYFSEIGLKKRAMHIWRMSKDYLGKNWRSVEELYGIGRYGRDAYEMFCRGNFEIEPKDRYLKIYKAWYLKVAKRS